MKIVITGAEGFLGTHLRMFLHANAPELEVVSLGRSDFADHKILASALREADAVVHFAGMNRGDDDEVYGINVGLAKTLVSILEETKIQPHLIFSSSTHIARDTKYGQSKKEAMRIFREWGKKSGAPVTNFIFPNIFGEFAKPDYNSAVATFCHKIARNEKCEVNGEASVVLLYVKDAVKSVYEAIQNPRNEDVAVEGKEIRIGELYETIARFKGEYFNNIIPQLSDSFQLNLFNTFRSYLPEGFYPRFLELKTDARGSLFETVKEKTGGQTFFSTTKPGITRGEHYHTRKIERFCVLEGKAEIKIRKLFEKKAESFLVDGAKPCFVDMPTFYTHNITNIGDSPLLTVFWVNEIFDPADSDTFFEKV
ncbi:MAG: NAD-dependent epimerase/dehydratase family protein [Candidatus Paceibacterota bacterium]|jgi:UDP-2-acetamido-2,6-beta-L-arabino-hexul-4-ose reductase